MNEERITKLNQIGMAWQLQRGGRRRQLKARDQTKQKARSGGNGANGSSSEEEEGEEPYILPGEVLIGSSACTPLSPKSPSLNQSLPLPSKATAGGSLTSSPNPRPLENPNTQQAVTSKSAMHLLDRASLPGVGSHAVAPKDDVLNYMLARNVLAQNLHVAGYAAVASPALRMLRGGASLGNPGFQPLPTTATSRLVPAAAQRNALGPVFSTQPSALLSLAAAAPLAATNATGSMRDATNSWMPSSAATDTPMWSSLLATGLLEQRAVAGAIERPVDETRLPHGGLSGASNEKQR